MIIKYSYFQDPVSTQYLIMVAYKPLLTGGYEEANRSVYAEPHNNPGDFVISVPTPTVHLVRIYESSDGVALDELRISFVATPRFDGPLVIPPLMIKVGRGIEDRDPTVDATEVAIPSIADYTISWVEQRGAGPLRGVNDTNDPLQIEWTQRLSGGIDLQNGKVFNDGEEYWLYFEPTLDGNVGAAVQDITELLDAHIQNTSNPHAVTKTQVGLSNIPNAISDSYQLNSSTTLATSKALRNLWMAIQNKILYVNAYNIGAINANSDRQVTITHNLNLVVDSYVVVGMLGGYSGSYTSDNKVTYAATATVENSFKVGLHNHGSSTANVVLFFILVDKP